MKSFFVLFTAITWLKYFHFISLTGFLYIPFDNLYEGIFQYLLILYSHFPLGVVLVLPTNEKKKIVIQVFFHPHHSVR